MITQLITDSLNSNKLDVIAVAGMAFAVFLVIHFFVKIKPAMDSKRRINRMVQRRVERKIANEKYMTTYDHKAANAYANHLKKQAAQSPFNAKKQSNNGYYNKYKGYQSYLKRNSKSLQNKQLIKHSRYKKVSSFKAI